MSDERGERGDCGASQRNPKGLDCREVFLRIDDYVDRALTAEEIQRVEAHLEACLPCARELGFTAAMLEEIRAKLRRVRAPEGLKARLSRLFATKA